jgi:hypothetical protein
VGVSEWDLLLAEFAALGPQMLGASVEPVDLLVRRVGDQRDLSDAVLLGERHPTLDGSLAGLIAGVGEVQLRAIEVVGHRALGIAGAKSGPRPSLLRVLGAADVRELRGWQMRSEPVEHSARSDRGELLAVADCDQLRPGPLYKLGQGIEPLVVDHPRLVQKDSRVPAQVDGPGVYAGDQRVEGERVSAESWAVGAETLSGRPGHGDTDCPAAGVLLGARGGVDHHALAGSGGTNEDGGALGTCEDLQRVALLAAQRPADALCDLARGVRPCRLADVSAGWLSELRCAALDRLLLGADGERRHPPALQGEHSPVADHLPSNGERLIRRHLPGRLLQRDRVQVTRLEHGVLLGQPRLDAILDRTLDRRSLGGSNQVYGLTGAEPMSTAGLAPHALQVSACGQLLRPAVLKREVAQLPALRRPAVAGAEMLSGSRDLAASAGELLDQAAWHPGDLEVAAVLARAALNRIALPRELLGERGAVERAQLTS